VEMQSQPSLYTAKKIDTERLFVSLWIEPVSMIYAPKWIGILL
jgi:hypothetical protein